jgi:hypothetical protein
MKKKLSNIGAEYVLAIHFVDIFCKNIRYVAISVQIFLIKIAIKRAGFLRKN